MSKITVATHERIIARVQGRRDGWFAAVEEIRRRAGEAFAHGDDLNANALRQLAHELQRHPLVARMDEEERNSLDIIERLGTQT